MENEEEDIHCITHAKVLFGDKRPEIVLASQLRLIPQMKGEKLKTVKFTNKKKFKKDSNVYACEIERCPKECVEVHKHYKFRPIRILALGGKVLKKRIQFYADNSKNCTNKKRK